MTDRKRCSGGALPGQCLNTRCENRRNDTAVLGYPGIKREAEFRRQCIENVKRERDRMERLQFLQEERRIMGMDTFVQANNENGKLEEFGGGQQMIDGRQCPEFDKYDLQAPDVVVKTMREPARPSCMLQTPDFTPPSNDYHELSRFLRISTMPGYNTNDQISEYHDNHNMAVWNNRKEIDPQIFKMKRDWLSVWGEFNVKEQCWRKAWLEKFGSH